MTTYESEIKTISSSGEMVFGILSDFSNLSKISDNERVQEKLKGLEFDSDSCYFSIEGYGRVGFRIIERTEFTTIKMELEEVPVQANCWIQLKETAENETRMKITIKAELPSIVKMMVDKKLEKGINSIANFLADALNAYITK